MCFNTEYKVLNQQVYRADSFEICPIRYEDRLAIMKWRNEQIYHLRQDKPLTEAAQDNYFNTVVASLFTEEKPSQILFSYLHNGICIGYGGLVHINWIDHNAEISFVLNTKFKDEDFDFHWSTYLKLIEKCAFEDLALHKIYTYAFDVRPHLYAIFEKNEFIREATLKDHCFFEGNYIDVIIYEKINKIICREATINDCNLYFKWVNNIDVRENSFASEQISLETHKNWFNKSLQDNSTIMYVFEYEGKDMGQVRFNLENNIATVDVSIECKFRGESLSSKILKIAMLRLLKTNNSIVFKAQVKSKNIKSIKSFKSVGFSIEHERHLNEKEYLTLKYGQ